MSNVTVRSVVYQIDGQPYESRLVFDSGDASSRPGLVMAPNWMKKSLRRWPSKVMSCWWPTCMVRARARKMAMRRAQR